jgi:hypothetical protein
MSWMSIQMIPRFKPTLRCGHCDRRLNRPLLIGPDGGLSQDSRPSDWPNFD